MIARVLIAQNSDAASFAQERDRTAKAFAPVKQFHAGASPFSPHIRVDVWIAELLVKRAVTDLSEV